MMMEPKKGSKSVHSGRSSSEALLTEQILVDFSRELPGFSFEAP